MRRFCLALTALVASLPLALPALADVDVAPPAAVEKPTPAAVEKPAPAPDDAAPEAAEEKPAPAPDDAAVAPPKPAPARHAARPAVTAKPDVASSAPPDDAPRPAEAPPETRPELVAPAVVARIFFESISAHNLAALGTRVRSPFYFEGKAASGDEIRQRWQALFNAIGRTPITLYGIEVLPYDEMVKKYGNPPAKLEGVPLKGSVIAVANLNGRATVAALRRQGRNDWEVFAFSD